MPVYQFLTSQKIPASLETVWEFISAPRNLGQITPSYMRFEITSKLPTEQMYPGQIVCYKVSPIKGMRTTWVTEITQVKDKTYFVDEQRSGPYRIWHHEHLLTPIDGGVLMEDIITYQPPFGIFGALLNGLFIRRKIHSIFDYRYQAVEKLFGNFDEKQAS